jgi:hypothetical protein
MLGFLGKQIIADVAVKVTADGKGGHAFEYSGTYAQRNGDLDFSKGEARKHTVKIDFAIADGSVDGIKFKPNGANGFWIVEKIHVGPKGCPEGPYKGDQFKSVTTVAGGKRLHVIDTNDDGKLYRYMLRFDLNGKTIVDDPDTTNGGPH